MGNRCHCLVVFGGWGCGRARLAVVKVGRCWISDLGLISAVGAVGPSEDGLSFG